MHKAVSEGLFAGIHYGVGGPCVSLLQFVDDIVIIGEATEENLWSVKAVLRCFELAFGLRVNYHKSCVIGVNISDDFLQVASNFLNCKSGCLPFKYLGIQVGVNPKRRPAWKGVLEALKRKLSSWKHKYVSLGGCVTLLNCVLNSVPIHYLPFYKAPSVVVKEFIRIQRSFLWGGTKEGSKISWVSWSWVCKPKQLGGLGVRDVRWFNGRCYANGFGDCYMPRINCGQASFVLGMGLSLFNFRTYLLLLLILFGGGIS